MKLKKNKGFTLLEVIITSAIMLVVIPVLLEVIINVQENTLFNIASSIQRSHDNAGLSRLGRTINSSSKFIARTITNNVTELPPDAGVSAPSSISQFYLNAIALPSSYSLSGTNYKPLAISSRILPVYDPSGTFSPSNITPTQGQNIFNPQNVGNTLMNITIEDFLTYPYSINGLYSPSPTAPLKKRFPLYQIHYFFLAKASNTKFGLRTSIDTPSMNGNNLILLEWKSQYLLDYTEVSNFVNCNTCGFAGATFNATDSSVLTDNTFGFRSIITNGVVKADLNPNIPIAGIIKQSETTYSAATSPIGFPVSSSSIFGSKLTGTEYGAGGLPMQSIENIFRYPSSDGDTAYGIALNNFQKNPATKNVTAGSIVDDNRRVPFFEDTSGVYKVLTVQPADGFPHGFEVMLSGTSGSTKVFIRATSLATAKGVASYNSNMITFQGKN